VPLDPGHRAARLASAADLIRERGCPAQICVSVRGQVVLDEAFGCSPDALFFLFSASGRIGGGPGPVGALGSRTTFGHNGSYVCLGWADPERQIAFGYVTARLVKPYRRRAHGRGQRRGPRGL
jgi:CubicO group peptidase (beta-lactamase class C family)